VKIKYHKTGDISSVGCKSKRLECIAISSIMFLFFLLFGLFPPDREALSSSQADDIIGLWANEEKDGRIKIYRCGEEYCGEIVWTKDGPVADVNNPKPDLRNRRIVGLVIMHGFRYAGDSAWEGGDIYDPKTGHTYEGKMTLVPPNTLQLRGYVLIPFLGRTTSWTRFELK